MIAVPNLLTDHADGLTAAFQTLKGVTRVTAFPEKTGEDNAPSTQFGIQYDGTRLTAMDLLRQVRLEGHIGGMV